MSSPMQIDHAGFESRIAAALCGGLSDDERAAFDAHAGACPAWGELLAAAAAADAGLRLPFAEVVPDEQFENRLIARLRSAVTPEPNRRSFTLTTRLHPMVRR